MGVAGLDLGQGLVEAGVGDDPASVAAGVRVAGR
jgi:hypothetical protein